MANNPRPRQRLLATSENSIAIPGFSPHALQLGHRHPRDTGFFPLIYPTAPRFKSRSFVPTDVDTPRAYTEVMVSGAFGKIVLIP